MNEEMKSQKEEFLLEVQKQILHKGLKSEMQENGRLHVKWNDQPLCEVDEYGRAWCRPVSVTCPEMKKSLRAVSKNRFAGMGIHADLCTRTCPESKRCGRQL